MPGPGPHMMYALGTGQALLSLSNGRFRPHHGITYALNVFFGPDMGSFSEWLTATLGLGGAFGSAIQTLIHHPFYYILILGFPLSVLYNWVSRFLLHKGFLDSISGSSMYTWILSTGWWTTATPINPDAVVIVSFLCTCLIGGFIYINRVKSLKQLSKQSNQSLMLIIIIASLYCLWCWSQIYLVDPCRQQLVKRLILE